MCGWAGVPRMFDLDYGFVKPQSWLMGSRCVVFNWTEIQFIKIRTWKIKHVHRKKNDKIKYKQSLCWNLEPCFLVKTLFRSKDGNRMGIVNRTKRALTRNRDNELIWSGQNRMPTNTFSIQTVGFRIYTIRKP